MVISRVDWFGEQVFTSTSEPSALTGEIAYHGVVTGCSMKSSSQTGAVVVDCKGFACTASYSQLHQACHCSHTIVKTFEKHCIMNLLSGYGSGTSSDEEEEPVLQRHPPARTEYTSAPSDGAAHLNTSNSQFHHAQTVRESVKSIVTATKLFATFV